ncbi:MAG: PorP/SprF family type IX secretion system membrane protein [Saprospiraceae bacterium]|nr:PorP/SprF family type IX secretion system membrane protein [Saprospiraceae bacterium]
MQWKLYIVLIFSLSVLGSIRSQDIHFSYYQFAPLNVNPAFTGAFYGSYRVSGIYSDKFASVTGRPYRTMALSVDAPIIRGIRQQDWVGVGFEMDAIGGAGTFHEMAPDDNGFYPVAAGNFQNWTFGKINAAYHFSIDKKQTSILTLGAQYAIGARKFNELSLGDTRQGIIVGTDADRDRWNALKGAGGGGNQNPDDMINLPIKDWLIGTMLNIRRKNSDLKIGFALEGLFKPDIGSAGQTSERKMRGLNIHGAYDMKINKKVNLIPGFYYYSLGPYNALNYNTHVTYLLDEEKGIKLDVGLGARSFRQAIFMAGGEYKDIKVGFAYDVDISSLSVQSGSVGGFELCVMYMGKIFKKPKPKPVVFCPRL